jgi:hypothetical protein
LHGPGAYRGSKCTFVNVIAPEAEGPGDSRVEIVILCIRDLYWPCSLRRLAGSHPRLGVGASILLTISTDWGFYG